MSNNHKEWPDVMFACLLMLAGALMLRYGVWHLVNHQEVVGPLFAGSGAVVLGALSIRQVLRSRSPRRNRFKRRLSSGRPRWWFWVIMISVNGSGIGSAQIGMDTPGGGETAASNVEGSDSIVAAQKLPRKYDLDRVGHRGIGSGFHLHSMDKEQKPGTPTDLRTHSNPCHPAATRASVTRILP